MNAYLKNPSLIAFWTGWNLMLFHKIAFYLAKLKRFLVQKVYNNLEYCCFVRPGPLQGTEIRVKEDSSEMEEDWEVFLTY